MKEPLTAGMPPESKDFAMKTYYGKRDSVQVEPLKISEPTKRLDVTRNMYAQRRGLHKSMDLGETRNSTESDFFFANRHKKQGSQIL